MRDVRPLLTYDDMSRVLWVLSTTAVVVAAAWLVPMPLIVMATLAGGTLAGCLLAFVAGAGVDKVIRERLVGQWALGLAMLFLGAIGVLLVGISAGIFVVTTRDVVGLMRGTSR